MERERERERSSWRVVFTPTELPSQTLSCATPMPTVTTHMRLLSRQEAMRHWMATGMTELEALAQWNGYLCDPSIQLESVRDEWRAWLPWGAFSGAPLVAPPADVAGDPLVAPPADVVAGARALLVAPADASAPLVAPDGVVAGAPHVAPAEAGAPPIASVDVIAGAPPIAPVDVVDVAPPPVDIVAGAPLVAHLECIVPPGVQYASLCRPHLVKSAVPDRSAAQRLWDQYRSMGRDSRVNFVMKLFITWPQGLQALTSELHSSFEEQQRRNERSARDRWNRENRERILAYKRKYNCASRMVKQLNKRAKQLPAFPMILDGEL